MKKKICLCKENTTPTIWHKSRVSQRLYGCDCLMKVYKTNLSSQYLWWREHWEVKTSFHPPARAKWFHTAWRATNPQFQCPSHVLAVWLYKLVPPLLVPPPAPKSHQTPLRALTKPSGCWWRTHWTWGCSAWAADSQAESRSSSQRHGERLCSADEHLPPGGSERLLRLPQRSQEANLRR